LENEEIGEPGRRKSVIRQINRESLYECFIPVVRKGATHIHGYGDSQNPADILDFHVSNKAKLKPQKALLQKGFSAISSGLQFFLLT
jgi:hypothetical protein